MEFLLEDATYLVVALASVAGVAGVVAAADESALAGRESAVRQLATATSAASTARSRMVGRDMVGG